MGGVARNKEEMRVSYSTKEKRKKNIACAAFVFLPSFYMTMHFFDFVGDVSGTSAQTVVLMPSGAASCLAFLVFLRDDHPLLRASSMFLAALRSARLRRRRMLGDVRLYDETGRLSQDGRMLDGGSGGGGGRGGATWWRPPWDEVML
jgi:uncharacterized membrane protein YgcG